MQYCPWLFNKKWRKIILNLCITSDARAFSLKSQHEYGTYSRRNEEAESDASAVTVEVWQSLNAISQNAATS
jgi:hypothetical protein